MIFHPILPLFICIALWLGVLAGVIYCATRQPLRNVKNFRRLGIIAVLIVILMRPSIAGESVDEYERKLNVFFIADFTGSMIARDGSGNARRYEQVQDDIVAIAKKFPGARYSLISLVQRPQVSSPLSTDISTLENGARALDPPATMYSKSTPLKDLLDFSEQKIARYAKTKPDYQNIVFFMSDGEDTEEELTTVNSELAGLIDGGRVFGYGSEKGAQIETISYNGEIQGYFISEKDADGYISKHISKRNNENLNNIASKLGLEYTQRAAAAFDDSAFDEIVKKAEVAASENTTPSYHEGYWIVAIVLAALLAWEFYYVLIELMRERKKKK